MADQNTLITLTCLVYQTELSIQIKFLPSFVTLSEYFYAFNKAWKYVNYLFCFSVQL